MFYLMMADSGLSPTVWLIAKSKGGFLVFTAEKQFERD
jgi:hypothetical protein